MILFAIPFLVVACTIFPMDCPIEDGPMNGPICVGEFLGEVRSMSKSEDDNAITYMAHYTNGDVVWAKLFTAGPWKDTTEVVREICRNRMGVTVERLGQGIFSLLKEMYEKQESNGQ